MSYALTDAGEEDMKKELAILMDLNEEIDQLACKVRDCSTVAPELGKSLDIAWYIAEASMREAGYGSCGHVAIQQKPYCACCGHFVKMRNVGEKVRRLL